MIKFALIICMVIAVIGARPAKYTSKFDNINVDEILKSDRLLNNYSNCLLYNTRCSGAAEELRKLLPEALETDCKNCTEKQKENAHKILIFLVKNKKELWSELKKKFDPKGIYTRKYEDEARKEGIEI